MRVKEGELNYMGRIDHACIYQEAMLSERRREIGSWPTRTRTGVSRSDSWRREVRPDGQAGTEEEEGEGQREEKTW